MTTMYRADHVGSLLRPTAVLEAHEARAQGRLSPDQLREIEDRAILTALDLQRQVGLDVLSDGEYRRSSWAGDFADAVDGYVSVEPPVAFDWRMPDGSPAVRGAPAAGAARAMPERGPRVIGEVLRQQA